LASLELFKGDFEPYPLGHIISQTLANKGTHRDHMEAGPHQQIIQTPLVTLTPRGMLFLLVALNLTIIGAGPNRWRLNRPRHRRTVTGAHGNSFREMEPT
jgi:hypothetical protein